MEGKVYGVVVLLVFLFAFLTSSLLLAEVSRASGFEEIDEEINKVKGRVDEFNDAYFPFFMKIEKENMNYKSEEDFIRAGKERFASSGIDYLIMVFIAKVNEKVHVGYFYPGGCSLLDYEISKVKAGEVKPGEISERIESLIKAVENAAKKGKPFNYVVENGRWLWSWNCTVNVCEDLISKKEPNYSCDPYDENLPPSHFYSCKCKNCHEDELEYVKSPYCVYAKAFPEEKKSPSFIQGKTVFLVDDSDWRDVFRLLPFALTVKEKDGKKIPVYNPLLVFHREGDDVDLEPISDFLIHDFKPESIVIFSKDPKDLPKKLRADIQYIANRLGLKDKKIYVVDAKALYSTLSKNFKRVVVAKDDYRVGMLASIYAARTNSLLVFENELHLFFLYAFKNPPQYSPFFPVGVVFIYFTGEDAEERVKKELERIIKTNDIILVNPNDVKEENCEKVEHGFLTHEGRFKNIYCKDSLLAPVYAAVKGRKIVFADVEPLDSSYWKGEEELIEIKQAREVKVKKGEAKLPKIYEKVEEEYVKKHGAPAVLPPEENVACFWITLEDKVEEFLDKSGNKKKLSFMHDVRERFKKIRNLLKNFRKNAASLTILSSPKFIPSSNIYCIYYIDGSVVFKSLDYKYLAEYSFTPDSGYLDEAPIKSIVPTGRVFGATPSEVSAYVNRYIWYTSSKRKEEKFISLMADGDPKLTKSQTYIKTLSKELEKQKYKVTCRVGNRSLENSICEYKLTCNDPETKCYSLLNSDIFLFDGHGWTNSLGYFGDVLDEFMPRIDNKISIIGSCLTASYYLNTEWSNKPDVKKFYELLANKFLRKGSLSYLGYVSIGFVDFSFGKGCLMLIDFLKGEKAGNLLKPILHWDEEARNFILIGDPTITVSEQKKNINTDVCENKKGKGRVKCSEDMVCKFDGSDYGLDDYDDYPCYCKCEYKGPYDDEYIEAPELRGCMLKSRCNAWCNSWKKEGESFKATCEVVKDSGGNNICEIDKHKRLCDCVCEDNEGEFKIEPQPTKEMCEDICKSYEGGYLKSWSNVGKDKCVCVKKRTAFKKSLIKESIFAGVVNSRDECVAVNPNILASSYSEVECIKTRCEG